MPITTQQPQFSFPSSLAFFDFAADCATKSGSLRDPVPGMVYQIGKRTMEYRVDTAATRKSHQIRLVEVRHAQGRFRGYIDALLRILGIRPSATVTPTQTQREAIFTAALGRRNRQDRDLERWKRELAAPPGPLDEASVQEGRVHTVVAHFTPEVGRIMQAVKHLYGHYPATQATDIATRMTEAINRELDAWLEPLSPELAKQVRLCLAKSSRIVQFAQIATEHPHDQRLRQLELDKVLRFKAPPQQCIALSYDLDGAPEHLRGLAPFNEVALGDMHGNCELLLHSLVQLGFLDIADSEAWGKLRSMLGKLQGTPMTAASFSTFRENLRRAVTVDPACLETRLTLLGDLLCERMHNDICMLAILDLLHQHGVNYQVILSNHDMAFIHYYLGNRSKSEEQDFEIKGLGMAGGDQVTSLIRCNTLLNAHPSTRAYYCEAAERAYFPHLNVCAGSLDGQTVFSHGFVNQTLFEELGREAGVDANQPLTNQLAQINDYLRNLLADDGAQYRATVTDNVAVLSALYAVGWNIGPGDSRYRDDTAVAYPNLPRINDPRLPHRDVRRAVHGHTQNVSTRISREHRYAIDTAEHLARLASADDTADLETLNAYLRSPAAEEPTQQVLDVLAPRIARRLVQAATSREARRDDALRLVELRTSLANCSPAAVKDLPAVEVERRRSQFFTDFRLAWNANCNTGDPITFPPSWATSLQFALENAITEGAEVAQLPPLEPVVQRLQAGVTELERIAAAAIPDAVPPANDNVNAYLDALKERFISLDGSAGMLPGHRKFARTVYVA